MCCGDGRCPVKKQVTEQTVETMIADTSSKLADFFSDNRTPTVIVISVLCIEINEVMEQIRKCPNSEEPLSVAKELIKKALREHIGLAIKLEDNLNCYGCPFEKIDEDCFTTCYLGMKNNKTIKNNKTSSGWQQRPQECIDKFGINPIV